MKVVLLIVAIYALIFNQASKQVNVKSSVDVNHIEEGLTPSGTIYLQRGVPPLERSSLRHITEETIHPSKRGYIFEPAVMQEKESQQSMFYPVYYPNAVNIDGRKS
jgi:hypothetical protein